MKKHVTDLSIYVCIALFLTVVIACSSGSGSGGDDGPTYTNTANGVGFNMEAVPSGATFTMGEHVQITTQTVTLSRNFCMGETEVTQGLWEAVWGDTWPETAPSSVYGVGPNKPAYNVSWYDAVAFCNLLTEADSRIASAERVYYSDAAFTAAYTKANATTSATVYVDWRKKGYRLPTEAEWEYAARYKDGTSWNHGNHASGDTEYACDDRVSCSHNLASDTHIYNYAWYFLNNGIEGTQDVGQKTENALGLRDMSGNVHEWCYDWFAEYRDDSETDPTGPDSGSKRVLRGGSWGGSANFLCCANRFNQDPGYRYEALGFRLCRTGN